MFTIPQLSYQIKKIPKKGRGIIALKDIEPGSIIGDYLGKVVHDDEATRLENKHGFYSMHYGKNACIFPDSRLSGVHLINHSCMPNCGKFPYKSHTLYFALRKIFAGEELSVGYNIEAPVTDDEPSFPCYCKTVLCKGTMCISPTIREEWDNFVDKKQMKYINVKKMMNKSLELFSTYPKQISDHKIYDIFCNLEKEPHLITDMILPALSKIRDQIRLSGRRLFFPKLGIEIIGVMNGVICVYPIKKK